MTDCQNLYKNSFLYHSASAVPNAPKQVPLNECVAFIGACAAPTLLPPAGVRVTAASKTRNGGLREASRSLALSAPDSRLAARAEASLAAHEPVLVHCMSGSSRCASSQQQRCRPLLC